MVPSMGPCLTFEAGFETPCGSSFDLGGCRLGGVDLELCACRLGTCILEGNMTSSACCHSRE